MMICKIIIVISMLMLLIGCSGFDTTLVFVHPEQVSPSETFDVALVNIYMFLTSGSENTSDVQRDSIHFMVGLPENWNVSNASMSIPDNISPTELVALQENMADKERAKVLLQQYEGIATPLSVDSNLAAVMKDSYNARAFGSGPELAVNPGNVKQWNGFGGVVDFSVLKGSQADTVISMDTALAIALTAGALDESIMSLTNNPAIKAIMPKTVGVTLLPVIIYCKITPSADTAAGTTTLYYFSKTAEMNPPASPLNSILRDADAKAKLAALEAGGMMYVPITISPPSSILCQTVRPKNEMVTAHSMTNGTICFSLGDQTQSLSKITIYSLWGLPIVTHISPKRSYIWDGCNQQGVSFPSGSYVAQIEKNGIISSVAVKLIR